jgi:uncharacterized delta-60 repeat protein
MQAVPKSPIARRRPRIAAVLAMMAMLVGAGGCALILGFEDTTVRTGIGEGGTNDGGPNDEGGPLGEGGSSRLATKPASIIVRRGSSADVTVEIARGPDVTAPVTASLSDLPVGTTATTAMIAPDATMGMLTITASTNATLGPKAVTLTAEGTTLPPAQVPLLVADPAGTLDVTFATNGLLMDPARGLGATFLALALQSDQQIVAGGAAGAGGAQPLSGWILRRYSVTGMGDSQFNAFVAASVIPADGELRAIAIDSMGRIVCVGSSTLKPAPQAQLTVARFNANGQIDATFAGGVVRLPAGEAPGGSIGYAVATQPDGAILVAGSKKDVTNQESGILTRFKPDGTRDTTFANGVTIVIANTRLVGVSLEGMAVVAAGSTTTGALPSYFLTRRTAQGANDPTFGTAGTATFGNTYRANGFARLSDGSLAVVGDVQQGAQGYTAGVTSAQGNSVFARTYANAAGAGFFGIGVQSDGKIVAAGHTAAMNGEARVERIMPDGNKDVSFGDGGTMLIEPPGVPNFDVTLFAAAVQADGRILAAGNRTNAGAVVYRMWP